MSLLTTINSVILHVSCKFILCLLDQVVQVSKLAASALNAFALNVSEVEQNIFVNMFFSLMEG